MVVDNKLSRGKTIEVFRTNIHDIAVAKRLLDSLRDLYPQYRTNVDLDDCDKILRIETDGPIDLLAVKKVGQWHNLVIEVLKG